MLIRNIVSAVLVAIGLLVCSGVAAVADGRVALVVGNGAYRNVPMLPNPPNDAADVATSLERLGFTVSSLKDASYDDLRHALIDFGAKARGADMAVIYFAGHGIEVAGEDWLIPVDAALKSDIDTENEAIGLKSLMLAVSGADTIGLVILDACRSNPFGSKMQRTNRTRAVDRGLSRVEPADNVLVAFAAKDGTTANDGTGRNSPFTAALLRHIETPGLEVSFLFRNVRDDVLAETQQVQQPFVYGSLSKEAVYLKPPTPGATPPDQPDAADIAWSFLERTNDVTTLRRFVDQFPATRHLDDAKRRIGDLDAKISAAAQDPTVVDAPTPANPTGSALGGSAPETLAHAFHGSTPEVEAAWSVVKTTSDSAVLRYFAAEFPDQKRQTIVKALDGAPGTRPILHQLRSDQMHAVLSNYGTFAQHPRYGEVWRPTVTPTGWHPYEPCHWINTRLYGWYYRDPTPWGAIVHHYGRWTHDAAMGWIWVPGVDFSPGWVVWRTGAEHIGWAPTPPLADLRTMTSAEFDNADVWIFMGQGSFAKGCSAQAVAPADSVTELLKSTVYVREFKPVSGIMVAVLPDTISGDLVDLESAFDPWPQTVFAQVLVDFNRVWTSTDPGAGDLCPPIAPISAPVLAPVPAVPPPRGERPARGSTSAPAKVVRPVPRTEPRSPPIVSDQPAPARRPARPPPKAEPPPVIERDPPRVYRPERPPIVLPRPPVFRPERPPGFRPPPPVYRPPPPPVYRPDPPPIYRPERPPVYQPDRPPIYRPDRPPGYRPDGPPGYRPDRPPGYRPDGPPGYRPERPSGHRPEGPPNYRPGGPSGDRPDSGPRWPGPQQGRGPSGFERPRSSFSPF